MSQHLIAADRLLAEARAEEDRLQRYVLAHTAALYAATAVAAAGPPPGGEHATVWQLAAATRPDLADQALGFAQTGAQRSAAEARLPNAASSAEADDMVRAAETFLAAVRGAPGSPAAPAS